MEYYGLNSWAYYERSRNYWMSSRWSVLLDVFADFIKSAQIAWVMGAADPTSGTVSLHEIVRGFGALLRKGWKPLRTSE